MLKTELSRESVHTCIETVNCTKHTADAWASLSNDNTEKINSGKGKAHISYMLHAYASHHMAWRQQGLTGYLQWPDN